MVVGDIVNGIGAIATYTYFQPAAGVEVMVTSITGRNTVYGGLYDGVTSSTGYVSLNSVGFDGTNAKIGITNTNYLVYYSSTVPSCFSGVQIK
jgi:hypothetical protein